MFDIFSHYRRLSIASQKCCCISSILTNTTGKTIGRTTFAVTDRRLYVSSSWQLIESETVDPASPEFSTFSASRANNPGLPGEKNAYGHHLPRPIPSNSSPYRTQTLPDFPPLLPQPTFHDLLLIRSIQHVDPSLSL